MSEIEAIVFPCAVALLRSLLSQSEEAEGEDLFHPHTQTVEAHQVTMSCLQTPFSLIPLWAIFPFQHTIHTQLTEDGDLPASISRTPHVPID